MFFDLGVGLGAPLAGVAAVIGGYPAAFAFAAVAALGTIAIAMTLRTAGRPLPAAGGV